jgi:hypothetical protein
MSHPLLPLIDEFENPPDLRCPTCGYGHLALPEAFVTRGDAATESAKRLRPDDFEADWNTGVSLAFWNAFTPAAASVWPWPVTGVLYHHRGAWSRTWTYSGSPIASPR